MVKCDLLIAESIRDCVFSHLNAVDLATVISVFVYESRAEEPAKIPRGDITEALSKISKIYGKIFNIESDHTS
jgi:ATP-dependent RNA helicase HelY